MSVVWHLRLLNTDLILLLGLVPRSPKAVLESPKALHVEDTRMEAGLPTTGGEAELQRLQKHVVKQFRGWAWSLKFMLTKNL